MEESKKRLTPEEALQKADECRRLATRVQNSEHRAMLEEMAQAWSRLAMGIKTDGR